MLTEPACILVSDAIGFVLNKASLNKEFFMHVTGALYHLKIKYKKANLPEEAGNHPHLPS